MSLPRRFCLAAASLAVSDHVVAGEPSTCELVDEEVVSLLALHRVSPPTAPAPEPIAPAPVPSPHDFLAELQSLTVTDELLEMHGLFAEYYTTLAAHIHKSTAKPGQVVDCIPFHMQPALLGAGTEELQEARELAEKHSEGVDQAAFERDFGCQVDEIALARPSLHALAQGRVSTFRKQAPKATNAPVAFAEAANAPKVYWTGSPGYSYIQSLPTRGNFTGVSVDLGVGPGVAGPLASVPAGSQGRAFPHTLNQLWWQGTTTIPWGGALYDVTLEAGWMSSSLDFIEPGASSAGTGTRLFVFSTPGTPDGYLETQPLAPKCAQGKKGSYLDPNSYDTWGGFIQFPGRAAGVLGVHTVESVAYKFQYTNISSLGVLFKLLPFEVVDGLPKFTGDTVAVGYWPAKRYGCLGRNFSNANFHVGLEVEADSELSVGKQTASGTIFGAGVAFGFEGAKGNGTLSPAWRASPQEEGWGLAVDPDTKAATFSGTFKCLDCIFEVTKPCVPCS